mmetsp:Transcript_24543/g.70845  ORF Transcript_24543/g.70845 Transcript_24543/m.70845 type:complete len:222 (-) Transcript_24543:239-904(-)
MVARVVLYLICVITIVFRCLAQVAESEAVEGFTHVGFGVCASGGEPSDFYSPIVEEGVVTSLGSVREQLAALGIPVAECARLCRDLSADLGVCQGIQHDNTTDSCLMILGDKPDGGTGGEANECFRLVDGSFESVGTGFCRVENEEGMIIGPFYPLYDSPGTNITAEYCFEYCLRMNEEEGAISTQTNQPFCTGVEVRDLCELQVVMAPTTASLSVCYAKN